MGFWPGAGRARQSERMMMKPAVKKWWHGLIGGFVGGMAGALDSGLALMLLVPKEFNLGPQLAQTIKTTVVLGILVGVKCACAYLKQSPVPPDVDGAA